MASQGTSPSEYILSLVNEALHDIETPDTSLSVIIRKSIHIARLRNDYINLWWLDWEMIDVTNNELKRNTIREIIAHFSNEELKSFWNIFIERWALERNYIKITDDLKVEYNEDYLLARSVPEIEISLKTRKQEVDHLVAPQGLNPLDLYFVDKSRSELRTITFLVTESLELILERIRHRVHKFLSYTEKQLLFGQVNADIFEKNRQFVDIKLGQLCPEALSQFASVYRRMQEKVPESYAQAAISCRRIIKSLADSLYPTLNEPIRCADGESRILSNDKYINRLYQYVYEQTGSSSSRELLLAEVKYLCNKIERLYDLTCKGAHAELSEFEINQCVIQAYLLAGDILRISENQSAINIEDPQLEIAVNNSEQPKP
jgi:hypothetical protein